MKYAYRFMPLDSYDIDGLENWLMDMASKKGLFLIGITGNFFKFQRGEPKEVRYRMEAVRDQEQEEPDEEEKELYRASGWEYVATRQKNFYIFRADDKNAPELYTDQESLAFSLKRVKKRMLKSAVVSGIIILAAVGTILAITFSGEYPFLNAVEEGLWKTIWAFLLMIFGLLSDFSMLFSYRKINRRLKGEKPSESRKGRSLRTAWSYLFYLW